MVTKVVFPRMRLVYCTRDLQMPGSPLLRTAFVLSAGFPRFMTGDISSVVPRCAPLPRSRAGGAPTTPPPTPAPSQRATAWTPICRRSYFVIKRLDVSCVLRHASCQSTSARRAFSCSLQSATRVWVRAPGPHPPGSALVRATRESVRASLASLALHSPFGARSEGGTPSRNAEVRGLPRSRGSRGRRAVSLARLSQLPTPLARPPSPLPPQPCSRGESALPPRAPLAQPPDIT